MHKLGQSLLAIVIGIGLSASTASALHNEPAISKTVKVSVVTAYEPCTTPDTTTSTGAPACTAVRSDPVCGFGVGHGLMYIRTKGTRGWAVKIVLLGLNQGCEGQTIHFFANLRTTVDDCSGATCTVENPNVELGSCIVKKGFCGLSTPLFSTPPVITAPGGGTEVTDLKGMRAGLTSFRYGIIAHP